MKRRDFVATLGAGLTGALLPPVPRLNRERFVERWSWAMGQAVHVIVYAESEDQGLEACAQALAELRRVEDRLSLFDDASDLCELNRRAGRGPMHADADLRAVLRAAVTYRAETAGAFDAAVEPLMRVWGFHRPRRSIPSDVELSEAREAVASASVRLGDDTVSLPNAHTQLDLGGIGVGYGIDRAIDVLRAAGMRRAFVDVSGDCYAVGVPPGEPEGWAVRLAGGGGAREVRLRNAGLATSSNTQSVAHLGRHVLGHVMDPISGWPMDTDRQVTVVASTAIAADALAKAALLTGRKPAGALAMYTAG